MKIFFKLSFFIFFSFWIYTPLIFSNENELDNNFAKAFQILIKEPASLLGKTVKDIITLFGPPDEVFAQRADEPEGDDVVFFYKAKSFYFFFYKSRVWAIRFDKRSSENFFNLQMGLKKEEIFKILAYPYQAYENSFIFIVPYNIFPLRLRVFFEKDRLSDIYLYRGDF